MRRDTYVCLLLRLRAVFFANPSAKGPSVSNKQKKITVLLDQAEFDRFDRFCNDRGFKKSTLLVRLIREFLASEIDDKDQFLPLFDDADSGRRKSE